MKTIMLVLCLGLITSCSFKHEETKKYTKQELIDMPAIELFDLFLNHGLVIESDISQIDETEMAELFKNNFQLFKDGISTLSSTGYYRIAQDTKKIYQEIIVDKEN